jgi:D-sedoheptulose 7-phosphate isomerase
MQLNTYNDFYARYFSSDEVREGIKKTLGLLGRSKNIFFIGNGGSNAICSHMMEDYAKIARFRTFGFTDPALITCFANDYGYEHAMAEWLKVFFAEGDLLVAISSSGNSMNIINAVNQARKMGGRVVALSGFKPDNKLRALGDLNFHLPIENYGVVECFHQVILHAILDEYVAEKQNK